MSKLKSIFSREREDMSQKVLWFFGLPLIYVIYFAFSLFVPVLGTSAAAQIANDIFLYVLLLLSFLLVAKFLLKKPFTSFLSLDDSSPVFQTPLFLKGLLISVVIEVLLVTVDMLFNGSDFTYSFVSDGFFIRGLLIFILLFVAALDEELIFRAYIGHFGGIKRPETIKGKIILSAVSGLLFTLAHFMNPETAGPLALWYMASYFVMGFSFMIFFIQTGRLEYSFGVHLGNNMVSAFFCGYTGSVLSYTNPLFMQKNISNPSLILIEGTLAMTACALVIKKKKN